MATSVEEQILRVAKEVAVKFIEMGRMSPQGFNESFPEIYDTIKKTVRQDDEVKDKK